MSASAVPMSVPAGGEPQDAAATITRLQEELQRTRAELRAARTEHARQALQAERELIIASDAIARLSKQLDEGRDEVVQLERTLMGITQEFATLTAISTELARRAGASSADLERLRKGTSIGTIAHPVYAEVHLLQTAPDILLKAARTAFRREHHPDTKKPHERAAAEAAFKASEDVFNRLFRRRGIR